VSDSYDDVLPRLRTAYDAMVEARRRQIDAPWKRAEREAFRARLPAGRRLRLVEIGAGTGVHGRWFADHGIDVLCTDASGAMVEACRALGLAAEQVDVLGLGRDESFDAAFAMNCLLHVPRPTLPAALDAVRTALRPGGLFYLGQYGGIDRAGIFAEDVYEPKRFFSYLTDDALLDAATSARFDVVDFHALDVGGEPGTHYQALTLVPRE
jgi:SAM-dependent methyltransferase